MIPRCVNCINRFNDDVDNTTARVLCELSHPGMPTRWVLSYNNVGFNRFYNETKRNIFSFYAIM